eukprot:6988748-Pyramimonas_sp.AAC.1
MSTPVHVTCPNCHQVSAATPGIVVACPFCQQHMQAPPQAPPPTTQYGGYGYGPTPANPQTVAEIKAVLPHVSEVQIAAALQTHNGNKTAAVNALLGGAGNGAPPQQYHVPQQHQVPQHAPQQYPAQPYRPGGPPGLQQAPVGGPPPPLTGRRKALLIGINYKGTRSELRGCVNDVHHIKSFLTANGFTETPDTMVVLTDDQRDPNYLPTKMNIINALGWLSRGAQPGDILFWHFSGHGSQEPDPDGTEEDGMNETIVPLDFKQAGQISDTHIFRALVQPLPSGVRLTAIMDCCHSGTGLDLPWTYQHGRGQRNFREETNPFHTLGDVQLFSGCEDNQTSADTQRYGRASGAMTDAFIAALRERPNHTYHTFLDAIHKNLRQNGHQQRPQLTASQNFGLERPFSMFDVLPNHNPYIGQQYRKKLKPARAGNPNFGMGSGLAMGAVGGFAAAGLLDMLF